MWSEKLWCTIESARLEGSWGGGFCARERTIQTLTRRLLCYLSCRDKKGRPAQRPAPANSERDRQIHTEELENGLLYNEKRLRGKCYSLVFEQESNQRNRPGGALTAAAPASEPPPPGPSPGAHFCECTMRFCLLWVHILKDRLCL